MILDKEEIKNYIPHREPFLFVDEVVELIPEKSITANVPFSEDIDLLLDAGMISNQSASKIYMFDKDNISQIR